jgi:hypothetical protein
MVYKLALLTACAALGATAADAQATQNWSTVPSKADMAAAYPPKAKAANVGGSVNLSCAVNQEGHTRDCAVLGEKPSGYGFGNAARKIALELHAGDTSMHGDDVRVAVTFTPEMLTSAPLNITKPAWAVLPSAADFQASFPKAENGINNVHVVLACTIQVDGGLTDCSVASEDPAGQGFGQGALALAPKFKVGPWSQDGQPTAGAHIRVPIRYQLTQVPPPKA